MKMKNNNNFRQSKLQRSRKTNIKIENEILNMKKIKLLKKKLRKKRKKNRRRKIFNKKIDLDLIHKMKKIKKKNQKNLKDKKLKRMKIFLKFHREK